jgi:hypothetical protein
MESQFWKHSLGRDYQQWMSGCLGSERDKVSEKYLLADLISSSWLRLWWRNVIRNEFVLFVGIARKIWFQRNTVVHGGEFLHLSSIARDAITSAEEYKKT